MVGCFKFIGVGSWVWLKGFRFIIMTTGIIIVSSIISTFINIIAVIAFLQFFCLLLTRGLGFSLGRASRHGFWIASARVSKCLNRSELRKGHAVHGLNPA